MKATPEDVAKLDRIDRQHNDLAASMKATPEDVAKPCSPPSRSAWSAWPQ